MNDERVGHGTGNFVQSASFGQADLIHGKTGPRKIENVGPWSVSIAECDYHVCKLNRSGDVWDEFGGSLTYCGHSHGKKEAYSIWKNHLLSIGVHAESAVMLK